MLAAKLSRVFKSLYARTRVKSFVARKVDLVDLDRGEIDVSR